MKTYIVYKNGCEVGFIKAGSHNSAEKKAKNKYGTAWSHEEVERYARLNPHLSYEQARDILIAKDDSVSVAYTEV